MMAVLETLAWLVLAVYVGKALWLMAGTVVNFIRWRWHDRKDHAGIRK